MRFALLLSIMLTFAHTAFGAAAIDVRDTDGNFHSFPTGDSKFLVLFFADRTCPVANKYVVRINELEAEFGPKKVSFLSVYPGDEELWPVARHVNEFKVGPPAVLDVGLALRRRFTPKVLSEVVVIDREMKVRYQGRIDDQFALGETRAIPQSRDLFDALSALISGRPVEQDWKAASGCGLDLPSEKTFVLTYMKDIRPVIENRCQKCHREGGAGPFPLTTYDEVQRMAPAVSQVLKEFRMPPWFADTKADHFSDANYLPLPERLKILSWIEAGAPRGNGAEKPAVKPVSREWTLGTPDQIINMPTDTVVPASGRGYFKEFAFDPGHVKDLWVDKVEFRLDKVRAVHHFTLYTRKKGQTQPTEYEGERWGYFATYVPGSGQTILPKGMAKRVPVGHEILVNVHYVPFGAEAKDRSTIGLFHSRAKSPVEIHTDSARLQEFEIPPGRRFFELEAKRKFDTDVLLRTLVPHAHYRGRAFTVSALSPDGTRKELLSVPKFTIAWQTMYNFKKPVRLKRGTTLECRAIYDNSPRNPSNPDPKAKVGFGPESDDEMMFCYYDYTTTR